MVIPLLSCQHKYSVQNRMSSAAWFDPVALAHPHITATILTSISVYLYQWGEFNKFTDKVTKITSNWLPTETQFDFIIVGGGTAGSILASKLSNHYHVLLLEAGGRPNPLQDIPAFSLLLLNYPEIDWKHKTIPQKYACGALTGNHSYWSQGKGLGGSSNINFLIQSRGHPQDYDRIANITGDPSWYYLNLLPYFTRSEDYHGPWDHVKYHGHGGPVRIEQPEYTGMADLYVRAARELGYPSHDLNAYFTEAFDTIFYSIEGGRRDGVYRAYLEEAIFRRDTRLTVRNFCHVRQVLINENNVAYGVEYDWHGTRTIAYAGKEVIVSAGTVMSPKILMLSGIGPKKHLDRFGIDVKSNRPVGRNLQDHVATYLGPFIVDKHEVSFNIERDVTPANVRDFITNGKGVLTTTGAQAMGFLSSSYAKARGEATWPDTQLILVGVAVGKNFPKDFSHAYGVRQKVLDDYWKYVLGKESFHQIVSVGRPKARGVVKLTSADPYAQAYIDPRYLNNEQDLNVLLEGVKKAVALVEETPTFKRLGGRFTRIPFPGCEQFPFKSDEYWKCYIQQFTISLHHIVGTCAMGRVESPKAVVDSKFRVIGVDRLRVIDASVIPEVVVGNTIAATIMIGEKGTDVILKDYEDERLTEEERYWKLVAQREKAKEEAKRLAQAAKNRPPPERPYYPPQPEDNEDTDDADNEESDDQ